MIQKVSKYKNLKFKSHSEFSDWLRTTMFKTIHLVDNGQDITRIYIDEFGEVLHTNWQAKIYNGRFVNLDTLKKNTNLVFWNPDSKEWDVSNLQVSNVELMTKH